MSKYLVTGGLGFIGNELVRQLSTTKNSVDIIDSRRRIAPDICDLGHIPCAEVDITNESAVDDVFARVCPEVVFHLAALHFIPECNANPALTMRVNLEGTLTVARAAARFGCKRFVFASSGAVYADSPNPLSENSICRPVDIYGLSKMQAETIVEWAAGDSEMRVAHCRLFNNYGPRETNAHIIPEICSQLKKGNRLQLGNIDTIRDYIHTRDCASALIRISEAIEENSPKKITVNVGTGDGYSVRRLIALMSEILQRPIQVESIASRFRKADKLVQTSDITYLKSITDWAPMTNIKDGLAELLKYEGLLS